MKLFKFIKNMRERKNKTFKNKATVDECKRTLELFTGLEYSKYFNNFTMSRGKTYFEEGKIVDFQKNGIEYKCKVEGTENYYTTLKFKDNKEQTIEDATCTCPYIGKYGDYCKHIYAVLFKIKGENNRKILIDTCKKLLKETRIAFYTMLDYIEKNQEMFSRKTIRTFNNQERYIKMDLNTIEGLLQNTTYEDYLLNVLTLRILPLKQKVKTIVEETLSQKNLQVTNDTFTKTQKTDPSLSELFKEKEIKEPDIYEMLENEEGLYDAEELKRELIEKV